MKQTKTAVVIGASSGIGAALACELAREGYRVALVARRSELLAQMCAQIARESGDPGRALSYTHDVRQFDRAQDVLARLLKELGQIDLVAYVAGYWSSPGPDEYDFSADRQMIEVNLLGAINWFDLLARYFQSRHRGVIIGISSVAGDRGRRGNPAYAASKAALTTYLESLRNRLGRYHVRVITVKPGFVATAMLGGMKPPRLLTASPEAVARAAVRAARHKNGTIYVPRRWALIMWIVRHIPSPIFRHLSF
jgi:short-subunit dehydrogenase